MFALVNKSDNSIIVCSIEKENVLTDFKYIDLRYDNQVVVREL